MENMDTYIIHDKTSGKTINMNRLKFTQLLARGKELRKVRMLIIGYYCCYSVAQSCLTLCNPKDCSTSGLPGPYHLPEFAQVHAHCIGDAIQPSHPLRPSSSSALSPSQHQGLFQWVICWPQMTKILQLQLQHQSFQWIFRVDLP